MFCWYEVAATEALCLSSAQYFSHSWHLLTPNRRHAEPVIICLARHACDVHLGPTKPPRALKHAQVALNILVAGLVPVIVWSAEPLLVVLFAEMNINFRVEILRVPLEDVSAMLAILGFL